MIIWVSILAVVVIAALVLIVLKINSALSAQMLNISQEVSARLSQVSDMYKMLSDRLDSNSRIIDEKLSQVHQVIGSRLDGNTEVVTRLHSVLGELKESYRQIGEKVNEIVSLQDMLKPPQMRGGVGESLLENIITQVFARNKSFYSFQYRFKSQEAVDAVIHLGPHILCIDAKFPLESYKRCKDALDDDSRKLAKRDFVVSVKAKIDDIAAKYILPDEGTFDFALMYIPAEGIYYEILQDNAIWGYALEKKVIPVSPNTFYPYLMVIWKGLKGMLLERNIEDVLKGLKRMDGEFLKFKDDFRVLGIHLKNARDKFEEVDKRMERFSDKLTGVSNITIEDKTNSG